MKYMTTKKIISTYYKLIIINVFVTIIVSLSIGYANEVLFAGNEVSYDNSVSGLNSTTVQGALDELCTTANFSDRVSTLESTSSSTTSRVSTLEGYFSSNPSSVITGNGIALGKTNTSTTGNTYIDFWYNNKIMANVYSGPNTNGSGLMISANNSSGTSGQGTLDLRGNPININGSGTSSATNIYGNPVKINGTAISALIKISSVTGTINKAYGNYTSTTAPTVSGYTFVTWIQCTTVGWNGHLYPEYQNTTTKMFNSTYGQSGTGSFRCDALYIKS